MCFFEVETDDDFRKYGHSKENRPNPLVQIGMFMDMDGLPLAICVWPGNTSEQKTLQPLEGVLSEKFGLSKFVVCTDGGLWSKDNRKYKSPKIATSSPYNRLRSSRLTTSNGLHRPRDGGYGLVCMAMPTLAAEESTTLAKSTLTSMPTTPSRKNVLLMKQHTKSF